MGVEAGSVLLLVVARTSGRMLRRRLREGNGVEERMSPVERHHVGGSERVRSGRRAAAPVRVLCFASANQSSVLSKCRPKGGRNQWQKRRAA